MTHLSHISSSIVIAQFLPQISSNPSLNFLIIICLSIWPDINILWHKDLKTHHFDWTHYPIFPIAIIILNFLYNYIFKTSNDIFFTISIFWLWHIILDSFGVANGTRLFWPINSKEFSVTKLTKQDLNLSEKIKYALKNGEAQSEIFLTTLSLLYILFK